MLEEPLQNGPLPFLIEILRTAKNFFLTSSRSNYKTFQLPLLAIDMCKNEDEVGSSWKKAKQSIVVNKSEFGTSSN
jgi:hypothetical protein